MRTSRVCAVFGAAVSAAIFAMPLAPAQAADLGYGSIKDIPPPPPTGSVLISSSPRCKNQAFRFKTRLFGFQYHFEFTPADPATLTR